MAWTVDIRIIKVFSKIKSFPYLIVVVNLFVADAARIDWRSVGILWVKDHRLVHWVHLL